MIFLPILELIYGMSLWNNIFQLYCLDNKKVVSILLRSFVKILTMRWMLVLLILFGSLGYQPVWSASTGLRALFVESPRLCASRCLRTTPRL